MLAKIRKMDIRCVPKPLLEWAFSSVMQKAALLQFFMVNLYICDPIFSRLD